MNVKQAREAEPGDRIIWDGNVETIEKCNARGNRTVAIHCESRKYLTLSDVEIIQIAD